MNKLIILSIFLVLAVGKESLYEYVTLNSGAPVTDVRNSQTVGERGPVLLQDYQFLERLQNHNRERIPERNVHARGAVAKGYYIQTADVSQYTFAKVFEKGKKTPIACRWSTVIHSKGSPEFLRDPRGFAIKMYTEEGNYDIVGLNFPIFFIRDGIRFPEMIRSLKPNPLSGVQEWWRIYDYFSNYPESTHMFSWLLDDVGIPNSYREVDGWGIHTYKWVNKEGKVYFARYYWKSQQGVKSLNDDEAVKQPFSFATYDLYDNIDRGNYPKWTKYVQLIDESDTDFIDSLDFDILDTTKEWPQDIIKPIEIGEFVFDENPKSQFLENEMIAFSPARYVPGIEPSDEKMLQTRMFAYADTQKYRLGVNNQMLPINKPKCPFQDQHFDGQMNFYDSELSPSAREVNYFPSTINPHHIKEYPKFPQETEEVVQGHKIRKQITKTDDFQQPGQRFRSWDSDRQLRFIKRVAMTFADKRITPEIKSIWIGFWTKADKNLGEAIQKMIPKYQMLKETNNETLKKLQISINEDHEAMKKEMEAFERAGGFRIRL